MEKGHERKDHYHDPNKDISECPLNINKTALCAIYKKLITEARNPV